MQSEKDFVEKVFDTGYSLVHSWNQLAENIKDRALKTLKHANENNVNELLASHVPDGKSGPFRNFRMSSVMPTNWNKVFWGLGITASSVILFWQIKKCTKVLPCLPRLEQKCILVFGDVRDPIVRSQVMDLYRRRFVVFICSKHAAQYREKEEEDDFLRHIDPNSANDLSNFIDYLKKTKEEEVRLVSILFMPNLAYYPMGDISLSQLEKEIHSNVLVYFNALIKFVPHIKNKNTQCILFNPVISYNMEFAHHSAELFVSGLINSVIRSLKTCNNLSVYTANIGILQIASQPSNYKYLNMKGTNISDGLLTPIYKLIMYHNGNWFQRLLKEFYTLGGFCQNYYFGKYSWLSSVPIFRMLIRN